MSKYYVTVGLRSIAARCAKHTAEYLAYRMTNVNTWVYAYADRAQAVQAVLLSDRQKKNASSCDPLDTTNPCSDTVDVRRTVEDVYTEQQWVTSQTEMDAKISYITSVIEQLASALKP